MVATNHPVAIEIAVRAGFDNLGASSAAIDDDVTSTPRGDHEVLAVGYDASGLIIENSWRTAYQMDGGRLTVVHVASACATSFTLNARVGHRYRIAVRAGSASNVGPLHYGATFVA